MSIRTFVRLSYALVVAIGSVLILSNLDFSVVEPIPLSHWLALIPLYLLLAAFSGVGFALIAGEKFGQLSFHFLYSRTLLSSLLNLLLPFSGTVAKLTLLKYRESVTLKRSAPVMVSALVYRLSASVFIALSAFVLTSLNLGLAIPLLAISLLSTLLAIPVANRFLFGSSDKVPPFRFRLFAVELFLALGQILGLLLVSSGFGAPADSKDLILIFSMATLLSAVPGGFLGLGLRDFAIIGLSPASQFDFIASTVAMERVLLLVSILAAYLLTLTVIKNHKSGGL